MPSIFVIREPHSASSLKQLKFGPWADFVHRGGWIGVCKSADPCLLSAKSVDPPKFLFKSETTTTSENRSVRFKGKLVHLNATVNFAQRAKKATCLMTTSRYNSNDSLTPTFKWIYFEKRNNLDELANIPFEAEERSVLQISFRAQGPNMRQAQSGIRVKNYSSSNHFFNPLHNKLEALASLAERMRWEVVFFRKSLQYGLWTFFMNLLKIR